MMKKIVAILLFVAAATGVLGAQSRTSTELTDVRLNSGFDISYRLSDKWRASWAEELYFKNDMRDFDRLYSRVTLTYTPAKNFRIAPMVLLINVRNTASPDDIFVFDLNFYYTLHLGRLALTLREAPRVKYSFAGYDTRLRSNPEVLLRNHLAASYPLTDRVSVFANGEIFTMLNAPAVIDNLYLQRFRSNVGLKYAFDARNAVSLYWRYDHTITELPTLAADGSLVSINSKHTIYNMLGVFYYLSF